MAVADLVSIESIKIIHARTLTEWVVVENQQSNGFFEQIAFDESMFGAIPSGKLILRDPGDMIADFNFTGKDKVEIRIIDRVGNTVDLTDYYIYQASRITDYADRTQPRMAILKFIHESYFLNERKPFEFVEAIKKVCSTTNEDGVGVPGSPTNTGTDIFEPGVGGDDPILIASTSFGGDSWVKDIFLEYFPNDFYNVDETENYAWLKNKPIMFPTGRKVDHSKVLTLLNYLAEFSNSKSTDSDRPRSDFFFWKDLSSTNFKSLKKLTEAEPRATFTVMARDSYNSADIEERIEKIDSIKVHPILSLMELETSGAFCSFYERLEPDFSNPYFDYTDNGVAIKKSNVVYRIHEHFPEANYKFYEVATQATDFTNTIDIVKNDDALVEYFNSQQGITLTIYTKRVFDEGKYGYFDPAYNNSNLFEHSYGFHTEYGVTADPIRGDRNSQLMWQTMFDIEEFNPVVLGGAEPKNVAKIYIDLKKSLGDKREIYLALRRIKERWTIFKYVVCCLNDGNDSFLALLTDYEEIIDGSYSKAKAYRYAWSEIEVVPKTLSYTGTDTSLDFETEPGDTTYASIHPAFRILIPAHGRTGSFDTRFEAYNLNEITNFEGIENSESIKIASPSTNFATTGYPEGFKNLPICGYPSTSDPCSINTHGKIVRMYQVNIASIKGLTYTHQEYENTPLFYFFDEVNEKEGSCGTCP